MAERLNAPVLKTGDGETRSRVQIPAPPLLFNCSTILIILDQTLNTTIKTTAMPNAFLWILAHAIALSSFIAIDWVLNEKVYYRNSGILILPLLVGLIQMLLLWKQLRWPWVWPILTILGIPLSFLGIWWFMLCIGGGFGVTQSIHLKLSGYRRVYLWILLSFSGWVSGALAWSWLSQQIQPPYFWDMIGLYGSVGLAYGTSTWFALRMLKRKLSEPEV